MLISKIFCIQDEGSVLHRIVHLYNLHFHLEGGQHLMHVGLVQMILLLMTPANGNVADFSSTILSGGSQSQYVMVCPIWYYFYNLKNVKNTHGGVLLLVKLQASPQ